MVMAIRKVALELKDLNFLIVGTNLLHFSSKSLHIFLVLKSHFDHRSNSSHEKNLWLGSN